MVSRNVDNTSGSRAPYVISMPGDCRTAGLETENARLKQLVAELLIKNHELREMHRYFGLQNEQAYPESR